MSAGNASCEVRFDRFQGAGSTAAERATYGVGRVVTSGARVLAPAAAGDADVQSLDPDTCIPVPAELPSERALLIPRLARVLAVWDCAELELGEAACITSGSVDAALFCLVASWRTGRTPVYLDLGDGPGPVADIASVIPADDPQSAIETLAKLLRPAPGTVCVVLSPSARAIDVLLEVLPTWGSLLLATPAMDPAAVDFYNHVHRKGARLLGVMSGPMCVLDPAMRPAFEPQIRRAIRILKHEFLAASCLLQAN